MTQGSGEIQVCQRSARPRNALEGGPESHQCCGSSGGATDSSALQYKQQCGKDVNRWLIKEKMAICRREQALDSSGEGVTRKGERENLQATVGWLAGTIGRLSRLAELQVVETLWPAWGLWHCPNRAAT